MTTATLLRYLEARTQDTVRFAPDYAEPGYDGTERGVILADWNAVPSHVFANLERLGYGCEWSDEWVECDNCNRAVRSQPDSYCWTPAFMWVSECEVLCRTCAADFEPDAADSQGSPEEGCFGDVPVRVEWRERRIYHTRLGGECKGHDL